MPILLPLSFPFFNFLKIQSERPLHLTQSIKRAQKDCRIKMERKSQIDSTFDSLHIAIIEQPLLDLFVEPLLALSLYAVDFEDALLFLVAVSLVTAA